MIHSEYTESSDVWYCEFSGRATNNLLCNYYLIVLPFSFTQSSSSLPQYFVVSSVKQKCGLSLAHQYTPGFWFLTCAVERILAKDNSAVFMETVVFNRCPFFSSKVSYSYPFHEIWYPARITSLYIVEMWNNFMYKIFTYERKYIFLFIWHTLSEWILYPVIQIA